MAETPSGPALTSANLQPREPTTPQEIINKRVARSEGALLFDQAVVAKPLTLPGRKFRVLNQNVSFRWINCTARNGLQVQRMTSLGFVKATDKDILFTSGDLPFKEGCYKDGDRLLMKLDKTRYLGALKHNFMVAEQRVSRLGATRTANAALRGKIHMGGDMSLDGETTSLSGTLSEVNAPQALKDKIQVFAPGQEDVHFSPDPEVK